MGSLETNLSLKRDHHLPRSSSGRGNSINGFLGQRTRSRRFARWVLFKKIDYLQLICGVAVFFFFVFLFQIFFLPGHVIEGADKSGKALGWFGDVNSVELAFLKDLDFGEDIKFEPLRIVEKFQKDASLVNDSVGLEKGVRFGYRKPRLALIFADLWVDQHQILMATVASALLDIGYEIEVFTPENGPARAIWEKIEVSIRIITADENMKFRVDWLNYDAILVNSLQAVGFLSCLMQEPFKNVPLIWTVHEQTFATRLRQYVSSGQTELIDNWRKVFARATVIVFPNYILPMVHSACDPGNYFVIPGSPEEAWKCNKQMGLIGDNPQLKMEYGRDDFIVAIVGSQLGYKGLWLEHALVLQALRPLFMDFGHSNSHLKIVVSAGNSTGNYNTIVEVIATKMGYEKDTVKHVAANENMDTVINTADLVIYGSFLDEHSFPDILLKAMCYGKPIVAPDLPAIKKYVSDRVNGFLFPKDDITVLTQIMYQMFSNGKLSPIAHNAAAVGKHTVKNLMVSESVEGYASLLENVVMLQSEVAVPQSTKSIPPKLKAQWQWHLFEDIADNQPSNKTTEEILEKVEKQFNRGYAVSSTASISSNDSFVYAIWEEQKLIDSITMRKRREEEELKDRTDLPRGTWDDVYRSARRADRSLHERDEGELERTGQPLCIYEPYFGPGTWPFLHRTSLYRGLGLSTKGRRPGTDDIDAPSRLPLLSNSYYRDVLGEYGAFFAIANRIDRIHKNYWIGFQSWRATAKMKSLSKTAEKSLRGAIEARTHGDALYFWVRLDTDERNPLKKDFWSFCDAVNAGNCQFAFSEALIRMYGIKHNLSSLPPMPYNGGTWSVRHSWALPTKSFLEFVMFSRMFVDALDAEFFDDHQRTGRCPLSVSKDKHCYSRLLELLVNVWVYHSARRIVYVDPISGIMQEHHVLKSRRGKMWIKWFQLSTLKSMDEDLAEEMDSDRPKRRWLWPSTGEVFWQGMYEKERNMRNRAKEKKRQQSKDKIQRIRKRTHQKALGKYVKPLAGDEGNDTVVLANRLF